MGRPKGGTNRKWSKEEKLGIVRRYLDEGIGSRPLGKQEGIRTSSKIIGTQNNLWKSLYPI